MDKTEYIVTPHKKQQEAEEKPWKGEDETDPFKELYRKVKITYSSRFNASRRLRLHQSLSLWTISLISVGLILMPLLMAFKVPLKVGDNILNLLQVGLAVAILTFSIIANMSNYSDRAEKFHACGLELNTLGRELKLAISKGEGAHAAISGRYDDILRRYETHTNIDFYMTMLEKFPHKISYPLVVGPLRRVQLFSQYSFYFGFVILEYLCIYIIVDWSKVLHGAIG